MSSSSLPAQNRAHGISEPSPPATAERKSRPPQPRVRRRNRLITSCLECRRRKLKCDKAHPCTHCAKNSRQCVFIAPGLDIDTQAKLAKVKEQMGILERRLEEDVALKSESTIRPTPSFSRPSILPSQEYSSDQEDDDDTKELRPTYLVTEDAAYYEPGIQEDDVNDDIVDLGFAMGRVRITERIGGLVRPRFSDELAQSLSELPQRKITTQHTIGRDGASWLAPSKDYLAPSSNFVFAWGVESTSPKNHLPAQPVVDKLVAHYWKNVHVIARTVHRPSFERQYQNFWIRINTGMEPRTSFQAVLFAALLGSVVSMSEDTVRTEFCIEKQSFVDKLREGTEAALGRANFLRTTKLETLQAFVMYLIPLCRNEVSRAHSALTGSLIRLAECMGLHRDPTAYSDSPIEIQIRRLLWYQICFLDMRTGEAVGPRPQIRLDDYDTRFPLNVDDIDLERAERGEAGVDVSKDRAYFTDMTISRMRFECYEMHRFLWSERPKLDRKRADGKSEVSITSLLSRVQSFQAAMEKTYLPILNKPEPLHVLASELYGIVSNRLYVSLLQKYITSAPSKMPERLKQLTLSAATMILEHGMAIEQHPTLSSWSWIVGALHQHHCALLLVNEIYIANLEPAMEQRIWRCLDYSFKLSAGLSNVEKTRLVLEELVGKMKMYADLKRIRPPTNMPQAGPRLQPEAHIGQREPAERRESPHSHAGRYGPTSDNQNATTNSQRTSPPQPMPDHQQQQQQQTHAMLHSLNKFPGSMPTIDWGTIDMPTSLPSAGLQPPQYNNFTATANTTNPNTNPMPTAAVPSLRNDTLSPNPAIYGTGPGPGTTTIDAINDIDWNDVEEMFGASEMGVGNMLIPPYSFPQFELAADVQWPPPVGR
ncbi:hypothetical protein BDW02DRAFT_507333 [Decorospora gaudefroyi]|uniref:Zn(2)-C6 fungal-type domain-containing protein n=1 Tax=Decorospora gaudefroyi TaxID=184978 RepID=A0A6A5K0T3_9PLEO|nr:hypothetical protein BDW02DRAFT_507333 [Decorospora gaudefroyi]